MSPIIQALVVDLGDVLFCWHPPEDGKISPKVLKRAMSTRAWYDFERGMLSEEDCYSQIGALLLIPRDDLGDTIKQAKMSLKPDQKMLRTLRDARDTSYGQTKIYLMSNISQPHWKYVQSIYKDWDIFDQIFTSAGANMRKPDLCFYEYVLESIGLTESPSSALFIDDKLENVCSARAVGMQGLIFDNTDNVIRQVRNMLGNPIARGTGYLSSNAKRLRTTCNTPMRCNIDMKENFAQLLILENTHDRSLVAFQDYRMLWNFFQDQPILTTTEFPNDYDTTSLALTILEGHHLPNVINQILDASLSNQSPDHIPLVYDDPSRPRFDPIASVHIYTLFHLNHRSDELAPTWNYICDFLSSGAYEQGTYYYAPPEYFLYALARMISYSRHGNMPLPTLPERLASNRKSNAKNFHHLLKTRCRERINTGPSNAIGLALRIIACRTAGITSADLQSDTERLKALQEVDGGWPWCEIYRAPCARASIGSRGVVTSFAVRALKMMDEHELDDGAATRNSASILKEAWKRVLGGWWPWVWRAPRSLRGTVSATLSILLGTAQYAFDATAHVFLRSGSIRSTSCKVLALGKRRHESH